MALRARCCSWLALLFINLGAFAERWGKKGVPLLQQTLMMLVFCVYMDKLFLLLRWRRMQKYTHSRWRLRLCVASLSVAGCARAQGECILFFLLLIIIYCIYFHFFNSFCLSFAIAAASERVSRVSPSLHQLENTTTPVHDAARPSPRFVSSLARRIRSARVLPLSAFRGVFLNVQM